MSTITRIVLAVLGLAIAAGCVFGFMATFEPMPAAQRWTWRIVYGAIAALCVAGVSLVTRCRRCDG